MPVLPGFCARLLTTSRHVLFPLPDSIPEQPVLDSRIGIHEVSAPSVEDDKGRCELRGACMVKLLDSATVLVEHYASPVNSLRSSASPALACWFKRLSAAVKALKATEVAPVALRVKKLKSALSRIEKSETPKGIVTQDRISQVLTNPEASSNSLKEVGLVPLLEPRFDEK